MELEAYGHSKISIHALREEGVDRNSGTGKSGELHYVALLAEGVDRNNAGADKYNSVLGRPPRGGRR